LQALIIAALESLCRLGEVLALKGEDVHLDNRTLLIAAEEVGARKTKKARSIPISDRLAAVRTAIGETWCSRGAKAFNRAPSSAPHETKRYQ
jgi:integrase